jgi:mono/diheme cytochrome c family protein
VGLRFVAAGLAAILLTLPPAAAQDSQREPASPERTRMPAAAPPVGDPEHGRYLVERVVMCIECHSPRDAQGNRVRGEEFTGGTIWFAPPWKANWADRAPRIRGLPGYTPELMVRLLTQGAVDRQGLQLRPPMPPFRMTPQDAADVYAYLSSLN